MPVSCVVHVVPTKFTLQWFYDVRNDSDALYNLYGVNLNNVYDLQLLELANRLSKGQRPRFLKGLGKSTEDYLVIDRDWP